MPVRKLFPTLFFPSSIHLPSVNWPYMLCVTVRMRTCSIDTLMVLILSCDWLAIDCNWPQGWRGRPVSLLKCHDDVIKWKQFLRYWPFVRGNSLVPGEFPTQRPVTRSFDVFFDLRMNKWLSRQFWGWWFEMLSCPLWCRCNGLPQWFPLAILPVAAKLLLKVELILSKGNQETWVSFSALWSFSNENHIMNC